MTIVATLAAAGHVSAGLVGLFAAIVLGSLCYAYWQGWRRPANEPTDDLDSLECDAEYAARELLAQCDRVAALLAGRSASSFYVEHIAEIRSLTIALAKDRTSIERLTRDADPVALGYAVDVLKERAEKTPSEAVAEDYSAALKMRESQREWLGRLAELKAAGNACWEHLSAIVGELTARTAAESAAASVQAQRGALQRLTSDVQRYNESVTELDTYLRPS